MPVLPAWAPEVIALEGRYLLFFTAREKASGRQCTGVATSTDPLGPFSSDAPEPMICQRDLRGMVDASPFRDAGGRLYLHDRADANAVGKPTHIYVQPKTPDGLGLTGEPVALLDNDQPWEAHAIESPTIVRRGDAYVLFYSANHSGWEPHQRLSPYAMGYATCEGPLRPCTDAPENPILYSCTDRKAGCLSGPGHQAVFEVAGRQFIMFHAPIARGPAEGAADTDAAEHVKFDRQRVHIGQRGGPREAVGIFAPRIAIGVAHARLNAADHRGVDQIFEIAAQLPVVTVRPPVLLDQTVEGLCAWVREVDIGDLRGGRYRWW